MQSEQTGLEELLSKIKRLAEAGSLSRQDLEAFIALRTDAAATLHERGESDGREHAELKGWEMAETLVECMISVHSPRQQELLFMAYQELGYKRTFDGCVLDGCSAAAREASGRLFDDLADALSEPRKLYGLICDEWPGDEGLLVRRINAVERLHDQGWLVRAITYLILGRNTYTSKKPEEDLRMARDIDPDAAILVPMIAAKLTPRTLKTYWELPRRSGSDEIRVAARKLERLFHIGSEPFGDEIRYSGTEMSSFAWETYKASIAEELLHRSGRHVARQAAELAVNALRERQPVDHKWVLTLVDDTGILADLAKGAEDEPALKACIDERLADLGYREP